MRIVAPIALAVLAVLAAPSTARAQDVTVSLALDRADAPLGEEVQAEVTVTNPGDKDVTVAELAFEERSLSFEISFTGGAAPKTFLYSVVKPDPHVADRVGPARVSLKPKKSVTGLFRIPTLRAGTMTVAAVYKGAEKEAKSSAINVKVAPVGEAGRLAAAVETSVGAFQIDLMPEDAPNTVANFVALARRGFFDNLNVHRAVKNGWIQTGCPYDNGTGGPGYAVRSEAESQKTVKQDSGTVAMAGNLKSGFSGSQFFICVARQSSFDAKFTAIGTVAGAGLDVVKKISAVEVDKSTDRPVKDVKVSSIKIIAVK
jgi:peptidyl-prolyl cis-trans isomerase B (cyclophilin B)